MTLELSFYGPPEGRIRVEEPKPRRGGGLGCRRRCITTVGTLSSAFAGLIVRSATNLVEHLGVSPAACTRLGQVVTRNISVFAVHGGLLVSMQRYVCGVLVRLETWGTGDLGGLSGSGRGGVVRTSRVHGVKVAEIEV